MPSEPGFAQAVEILISKWLAAHPESAPHIAAIARRIAEIASAEPGVAAAPPQPGAVEAIRGPAAEPAMPVPEPTPPSPGAGAPSPVGIPKLSSGYVPLMLGSGGEPLQIKLPGTSAEIAAARQSAYSQEAESARASFDAPDLSLIARRCALKGETCRFVIERRGAGPDRQGEFAERVRGLLTTAKATPNCFLWMLFPGQTQPPDGVLGVIGACYANLERAALLAERVAPGSSAETRHDALLLLAAAQSALRVALEDTWLTKPDRDQEDTFAYLADATRYERVFLERYMKLDDAADPGEHAELAARIGELEKRLEQGEARRKRITTLVNDVRFHARRIAGDPGGDHGRDWEKIAAKLGELEGERALGDAKLAEPLRAVAGLAPPGLAAVLAKAGASAAPGEEESPTKQYSAGVTRVRDFLRGGRVVLVGGERRDDAERRIREAFDLADLEWLAPAEHSSSGPLEAPIGRADTRLVLQLIKLTGHHHAADVAAYCERYAKPLVRLPAGYNPEQIAAQVIEQASERLAPA